MTAPGASRPTLADAPLSRIAAPLAAALIVILAQVAWKGEKIPEADEFFYLTIADDLNRHGVFTDGPSARDGGAAAPGRLGAPTYPLLVHLVSQADPALEEAVACHVADQQATRRTCGGSFHALTLVQILSAGVQAFCVFCIAWVLSGSPLVSWLALGLALATGEFGYYAWTYLTENTALLGFYAFLALLVSGAATGRARYYAAAGAALGFAALSRHAYLYLLYAAPVALALAARLPARCRPRVTLGQAGLLAVAGAGVLAPWMVRNLLLFGDPALSAGYGQVALAQRLSYNAMSWQEWAVAWVYWIPKFGERIAALLFSPDLYARLGWEGPRAFYVTAGEFFRQTLDEAGGPDRHLSHLVRHYLLGDFLKHAMVTLPLTYRGIWVGSYLSVLGVILLVPVSRHLATRRALPPFLALVAPLLFMALLHGFVSVNVGRYNLPLIALYAFVTAYWIGRLAERR